jgi:hypothetical protein
MCIRGILLVPLLVIPVHLFSARAMADDATRLSIGGTVSVGGTMLQRVEPNGLGTIQQPSSSIGTKVEEIISQFGPRSKYGTYRDGFLKRHLSREGRNLSWVWLKDIDASPQAQAFAVRARHMTFTETARLDSGQSQAFTEPKTYVPWTYTLGSDAYAYGGDDNPLLHGGLAMATFALEYLSNRNDQSLKAAIELLHYALASEYVTNSGQRTGFFLRTRWPGSIDTASGRAFYYASADELSGLIYGLFWLNRALAVAPTTYQAEHNDLTALAVRFGRQLQGNSYLIMPPDVLTQERMGGSRELHRGWVGLFGLQWFAEQAFEDITGQRFEATDPRSSLAAVKNFKRVGGTPQDAEMINVLEKIGPDYNSFDRSIGMIKILGMMLYQEGRPLDFDCKLVFINVKEKKVAIPYEYYNFTYMLHLAQIGLQRNAEGKTKSADDLVTEMRRLTRGVIYADHSQTGFDADRFALAYATDGLVHGLADVGFAAIDWLPGTGCNLKDKHVGSRSVEDFNYYVLAIAQAYDLMAGDSNKTFQDQLPLRIDQARAQFGPDLPLSERKDDYAVPRVFGSYTPGVWYPQAFDRRAAFGSSTIAGRNLIAYHNMSDFLGGFFAWEHEPAARLANGGAEGDEGLCQSDILAAWAQGQDMVREGPGLDYMLPTALLAYRKQGQFLTEVNAVGYLTYTPMSASTLTPIAAMSNPPATRNCGGNPRPVLQYAANTGGTGRLSAGDVLFGNNVIVSPNGLYALVHQTDGNLVLYYKNSSGLRTALWATNTTGASGGAMTILQGDGDLVVYDYTVFNPALKLNPVWTSNTSGNPGSHLDVQNDGNMVIYAPDGRVVWATNTMQH